MLNYITFFVEKKIISAAKDVANTLGGDKTKTASDLLEKVLASRMKTLRKEQTRMYVDLYHNKLYIYKFLKMFL